MEVQARSEGGQARLGYDQLTKQRAQVDPDKQSGSDYRKGEDSTQHAFSPKSNEQEQRT